MRTPLFVAVAVLLYFGPAHAQQTSVPRMNFDPKPPFPPSYEVHIKAVPAQHGIGMVGGNTYWARNGRPLQEVIADLYHLTATRIDFPDRHAASQRYDIALVLPKEETSALMEERVKAALQQQLNLSIKYEERTVDAYVVTAPHGPGPELRRASVNGGVIAATNATFSIKTKDGHVPSAEEIEQMAQNIREHGGVAFRSLSVSSVSMNQLCETLERQAGQPVINQTHLHGYYTAAIPDADRTKEEFFHLLRTKLGLVITPTMRNVPILVVSPAT